MLTKADVRIAYSAGRAFNALEEDEIENEEMNNDSSDKVLDLLCNKINCL